MLLDLFIGFLKVGLFAFGGAYSAIPLIRDVVLSYGWLSEEMLAYMIAVSESTPGPIMVNLATYVGSHQAGFIGALLATAAVVLPSFLIILLVMGIFSHALKNRYAQAVLRGLKPCVVGIVLATGVTMLIESCFSMGGGQALNVKNAVITLMLFALMMGYKRIAHKKLSPILLIIISAALGVLFYA